MGVKILFKNIKTLKVKIADLNIKSATSLRAIKCPSNLIVLQLMNFFDIFSRCKSKGISIFRNLSELNQKESLDFYGDLKSYQKWVLKIL